MSPFLLQSHSLSQDDITLNLDIDTFPISIDIAIPCGLVLNELFSNTLKYAWPGEDKGAISISMTRDGSGNVTLTFSDDGVGILEGIDLREQNSFGMQIVHSIVEHQLQGTVNFKNNEGLFFEIHFNENLYKGRL